MNIHRHCKTTGLLILYVMIHATVVNASEETIRNWLCYYGNRYGAEIYSRFDLVVLDGHYHPPLHREDGKPLLLGYVSVGEVDSQGHLWPLAAGQPYLVRKNPHWNSWVIDVRDPAWQRALLEVIIPAVLDRGFDGIFLDTIDSALALLMGPDGEQYKGVETALIDLVRTLRERYPEITIAVNRGLPVLPAIGPEIDFVVVESLYSYYAGEEKGYIRVDPTTQEILLRQIEEGLRGNPDLKVLTLDYAPPDRRDLAVDAIRFSRELGFIPYVSTRQLDKIFFYTLMDSHTRGTKQKRKY